MTELSPDVRKLIDAARVGDAPSAADKARIKAALSTALGSGGSAGGASTAATGLGAKAGSTPWLKILALVAACGIGGGVAWVAGGFDRDSGVESVQSLEAPAAQPSTPAAQPSTLAAQPSAPAAQPSAAATAEPAGGEEDKELELEPMIVAEPDASERERPSRPRRRANPPEEAPSAATLREEIAVLGRARASMNAADASAALAAIEEHARRFRRGVLAEEREALRVQALCELGRTEDAKSYAQRFLRAYASSPHAANVKRSCAGADARGE